MRFSTLALSWASDRSFRTESCRSFSSALVSSGFKNPLWLRAFAKVKKSARQCHVTQKFTGSYIALLHVLNCLASSFQPQLLQIISEHISGNFGAHTKLDKSSRKASTNRMTGYMIYEARTACARMIAPPQHPSWGHVSNRFLACIHLGVIWAMNECPAVQLRWLRAHCCQGNGPPTATETNTVTKCHWIVYVYIYI